MIIFRVDPEAAEPPYEQLRAQVATAAARGDLPAGTRLPTVRGLAGDLGLAPGTVARAYRELEQAGLVETRGRAGTVVTGTGDAAREAARRAGADYAALTRRSGLGDAEALAIVAAALESARAAPGSRG